jgi:hypothetical protein
MLPIISPSHAKAGNNNCPVSVLYFLILLLIITPCFNFPVFYSESKKPKRETQNSTPHGTNKIKPKIFILKKRTADIIKKMAADTK